LDSDSERRHPERSTELTPKARRRRLCERPSTGSGGASGCSLRLESSVGCLVRPSALALYQYDGAIRVGILTASSEGYDIRRRLGFQDYCQVNVYLGLMDVKSNEETS
jgi:hypothetical protein